MERSVSLLLSLTREHSNSHKYSHSYDICTEIHKHPRRDLTAVTDQLQKVWAYCLDNPLNLPCSSQSDLILVSGLIAVSDINWKLHMNQQITWQYYINKQSSTQHIMIGQKALVCWRGYRFAWRWQQQKLLGIRGVGRRYYLYMHEINVGRA